MVTTQYEEYYDDHSFVFIVDRQPNAADVENTNKFLIHPKDVEDFMDAN